MILDTISKQTGLSFFYSSDLINLDKMVSVHIKKIYLDKDTQLDIELIANSTLNEVVVHGTEDKFSNVTLSTITVPLAEINKLPTLLGEQDAIKYLMLMPGVQKGNEGNNGMYV